MAKKLRIEAEIPLPEDHFAAAQVLTMAKDAVASMTKAVEDMGGTFKHAVIAERAPPKKPRLVKGAGHAAAE